MGKFSFSKEERLKSNKHIKELFNRGSSFYLYPFRILVLAQPTPAGPHQILISVSKRNFKRAVDRNRIKRRIREAYRLQKHTLPATPSLFIGILYTAKETLDSNELHQKLMTALNKIKNRADITSSSIDNKPSA